MRKHAAQPPLDGNTLRTRRTRARVLAESLRLFNERGEAQVTTGAIAAQLNMSPGNLYYHFRNKDQIIEQLFARFEERIDVAPAVHPGPEAIEDLWLYLHLTLEAIWEHRFLYRNLDDLLGRNRRLRERFAAMVGRKLADVERLFDGLAAARVMLARPEERRAVARNVLLVATYWMSFQAIGRTRAGASEDADLGRGAYQVMSLVAPYLVPGAREHLDRLGRSYID